jgi:hypothetical protein
LPIFDNNIKFTVFYPNEPWEDSQSTLTTSKDGRLLGEHVVFQRIITDDESLLMTTLYRSEADNCPVGIRETYALSMTKF